MRNIAPIKIVNSIAIFIIVKIMFDVCVSIIFYFSPFF